MRTNFVLIFLTAFLSFPSMALGEESSPQPVAIEHQGIRGFFFSRDIALRMLADLRELPLRVREIRILEEELEIRAGQISRLREMVSLEREATERALGGIDTAMNRAREAENLMRVWWRSPAFWLGVGIVATLALEIAAVYALATLSP